MLALSIAACCHAPEVRLVVPPPCLTTLAPTPPAGEDDAAWSRYWTAMAAWAAKVERSCGSHLLPEET